MELVSGCVGHLAAHAALERVEAGDPGDPQDEGEATEAARFEPEWLYIDWSQRGGDIHLRVRSWWGNHGETRGALGEINAVLTRVVKTQLVRADPVWRSTAPNPWALPGGNCRSHSKRTDAYEVGSQRLVAPEGILMAAASESPGDRTL